MAPNSTASSKWTGRPTSSGRRRRSRRMRTKTWLALSVSVTLAAGAAAQTRVRDLAEVKPEAVGFSAERLQRLHTLLQQKVEDKELAGIVTVLARHGKIVELRTYGKK